MSDTIRHEFYESDEYLTLSIFDRGADPSQVEVQFAPRKPLKGQINLESSTYNVKFAKMNLGRWGALVGDSPDPLATFPAEPAMTATSVKPKPKKNWEGITDGILKSDKEKTTDEDPNVGGDATLNSFFQKMFADADEDTKRAMMKSYSESGGTTLSTNWDEVRKERVTVKPPAGQEWKKWN
ncbi:SGS-domain-containing protein [Hymenopellis radicata]|nr:SGS-domain-containing protein [Hymenopellis radicata]